MSKLMSDENTYIPFDLARGQLLLASESISDSAMVIDSTLPTFGNHLLDLAHSTIGTFNILKNATQTFSFLSSLLKKENIDNVNFIDLSTVLITVPEGFKGNLANYSKVMNIVYKDIMTKTYEYNSALTIALGSIVTNKSEKLSSKSYEGFYNSYKKLREDSQKITTEYFDQSTQSKIALGEVYSNKNELTDSFNSIDELKKQIKTTNISTILTSVNEINSLLLEINNQIKLDPGIKFSPQVVQLISEGTYETAKYFEYLSVLFYECDVLIKCVDSVANLVKKKI